MEIIKNTQDLIGDFFYGFLIPDYGILKDEITLISVAIYTDEKIKKQEISKATQILKKETENRLSVEIYDILMAKIERRIEKYTKSYQFFLKEKFELFEHIIETKNVKKAKQVKAIFLSDGEISKDERIALMQLDKIINKD